LDEAMMRLFSRLCCIGALPALPDQIVRNDPFNSYTASRQKTYAAYATTGFTMNQPLTDVSAVSDVASLSPDVECWRSLIMSLTRMLLSIETVSGAALVDNINRFLCHPQCGLGKYDNDTLDKRAYMARAMSAKPSKSAGDVHPVMRSTGNDLAISIAARAPLTALPAASNLLKPLQKAGITTVADFLALAPEDAIKLAGSNMISEVNEAYRQAEALPATVAAAVSKAISTIDKDGHTAPANWTEKELLAALKTQLATSLKTHEADGVVDDTLLGDALDEWTANIKAKNKT
jgi:hypothetical protein